MDGLGFDPSVLEKLGSWALIGLCEMLPPVQRNRWGAPLLLFIMQFINLFLNQGYSENLKLPKYLVCVFSRLLSFAPGEVCSRLQTFTFLSREGVSQISYPHLLCTFQEPTPKFSDIIPEN